MLSAPVLVIPEVTPQTGSASPSEEEVQSRSVPLDSTMSTTQHHRVSTTPTPHPQDPNPEPIPGVVPTMKRPREEGEDERSQSKKRKRRKKSGQQSK